jgi:hypothetical protein
LVIVKKVLKGIPRLLVFIDAEKVLPLFFCELDLQLMVATEVDAKAVVELPDQLIALYGGDDTDQPGVLEEPFGHILCVQFQLHSVVNISRFMA